MVIPAHQAFCEVIINGCSINQILKNRKSLFTSFEDYCNFEVLEINYILDIHTLMMGVAREFDGRDTLATRMSLVVANSKLGYPETQKINQGKYCQ